MKVKANIPEILVGVFLAVAIFAMGMSYQSSRGPISTEPPAQQQTQQKTTNDSHKSILIPDDSAGLFTAVVAIFTAVLAVATIKLYSATRDAAQAALRQANVLVAAESPIFSIVGLKLVAYDNEQSAVATIDPVPRGVPPPFCRPLIQIANTGRTAVTVNRVFCDWVVTATVPELPEYHFEEVWNGTLNKDGLVWFRSGNGISLSELDAEHIENFGRFLWVYGKFVYTDFMGERFEYGYVARWDTAHGFVREPLAAYEYKRKS
jgi:hypothetical protein